MFLRQAILILVVLLAVGCASRPQVELEIARSEVAKAYAGGAKLLAPSAYDSAAASLHEAEVLLYEKKFGQARQLLTQTLFQATKATELARKRAAELDAARQQDELEAKEAAIVEIKKKVLKKTPPPKPKVVPPKPKIVLLNEVVVKAGETLLSLSGRKDIYNDHLLWPLLYKANRDQIKDPQEIYDGQVFVIPRDKSLAEQEAARKEARESDLFPR